MRNPLLEPTRLLCSVAGFVAPALGVGRSAYGVTLVTEEQADAAAVAARVSGDGGTRINDAIDTRYLETVAWAEVEDATSWFPTLDEDDLQVSRSPMQTRALSGVADRDD